MAINMVGHACVHVACTHDHMIAKGGCKHCHKTVAALWEKVADTPEHRTHVKAKINKGIGAYDCRCITSTAGMHV